MPEVLVATPLNSFSVTRTYVFGDGISIREICPIRWEISIAKTFLSAHERDALASTHCWLCASKEVEHVYGDVDDDLYAKAMYGMSALQIMCPSGSKNVFLKFARTDQGYDSVDIRQPKELCSTLIGRIASIEDRSFHEDFEAMYTVVKRAFTEKVVRIQNPILLLEHGMQTGNVHLGALMFVMALDMLIMAGEKAPFVERLGGFLGPQSFIFPPVMHRQPTVKVQDVLSDLYEFRNIIAHGQEIPISPYRQKYDLLDDRGGRINHDDYHYAELMLESALFLLARALRKISAEGLIDDVRDEANWRINLRQYEHRWRTTATVAAPSKRR